MKLINILIILFVFIGFCQCRPDDTNDFDRGNSVVKLSGSYLINDSLYHIGDTITYSFGVKAMNELVYIDVWIEQTNDLWNPAKNIKDVKGKVVYFETFWVDSYNAVVSDELVVTEDMLGSGNVLVCSWYSQKVGAGNLNPQAPLGDFVE